MVVALYAISRFYENMHFASEMRRKRKKRRFWLRFFVSFFLRSEISKPSFYSFISFQIAKMKPRFSHVYSNENVILSVYDNFFSFAEGVSQYVTKIYTSTTTKKWNFVFFVQKNKGFARFERRLIRSTLGFLKAFRFVSFVLLCLSFCSHLWQHCLQTHRK